MPRPEYLASIVLIVTVGILILTTALANRQLGFLNMTNLAGNATPGVAQFGIRVSTCCRFRLHSFHFSNEFRKLNR